MKKTTWRWLKMHETNKTNKKQVTRGSVLLEATLTLKTFMEQQRVSKIKASATDYKNKPS